MAQREFRTIYLLCPANVRTGGPEATHQLGRALRDLGHDARLVYLPPDFASATAGGVIRVPEIENPMPLEYAHYDIPRTNEIIDEPANAVVFPEIWPQVTRMVSHATRFMWWLSIDNGLAAVEACGGIEAVRATNATHLCQSHYALKFLAAHGILGLPLFDYMSPEHAAAAAAATSPRQDRVLFPARGRWFTSWLQRWAPDLAWQEISGFTPEQVQNLFLTSKLYVDFGSHPGKDRMPREAVALGCCVITGHRGAASGPYDIPILEQYKFRDSRMLIPRIVRMIRLVLAEYDERSPDYDVYRTMIRGERAEFLAQAARIFGGRLEPGPAYFNESPPTASAHPAASPG